MILKSNFKRCNRGLLFSFPSCILLLVLLWEFSFPSRLWFTAIYGTFQCFRGGYFIYRFSAVSVAGLWFLCLMWDWYSYSCGGLSVGGTYIVADRDQCESVAHNSWGHNCFWCSSSDGGIHLHPHFCEWALFFKSWSRNVAGNLGFHWMFSISIGNLHQDRVRYIVM